MADDLDEIFEAITRSGVAVRLESQHQAPPRESTARCSQRRGNLDRVVAVIFNHREVAAARCRQVTVTLKTPAHALELGQRLLHGGIGHIQLKRHGNR